MNAPPKRGHKREPPARVALDGGAVLFVETSRALPLVSIVIAIRSAACHDPEDKEGLARFVARMLRRGCKGLASSEIEDAIDRLGAELGVEVSQSTITVHAQVIRRNLAPFVELLARILGTPEFSGDEVARLRRESLAEILEMRDSDRALAQTAFRRALFAGHPYARSAVGRLSSIELIGESDARAFYLAHFVRGNVVIGFAGDISLDEARPLSDKLACALRPGPAVADPVPDPPARKGRTLVFVDKPERTQTQIAIGSMGTWPRDSDHFALATATAILGGTFTSRLMREVRSERGWSYGASARLAIERRRHAFAMWTFPAATDAAPCLALELDMLGAFVSKGVTPREVSFITNYLLRSYAFDIDTATKRLHQALDVELLDLPEDYYSAYLDRVKAVTPESANDAIKTRIDPEGLVIVVVGTASEIADKVALSIPGLTSREIVPFDRD